MQTHPLKLISKRSTTPSLKIKWKDRQPWLKTESCSNKSPPPSHAIRVPTLSEGQRPCVTKRLLKAVSEWEDAGAGMESMTEDGTQVTTPKENRWEEQKQKKRVGCLATVRWVSETDTSFNYQWRLSNCWTGKVVIVFKQPHQMLIFIFSPNNGSYYSCWK